MAYTPKEMTAEELALKEEVESAIRSSGVALVKAKIRVFDEGVTQNGDRKRDVSIAFPRKGSKTWFTIYNTLLKEKLDYAQDLLIYAHERWCLVAIGDIQAEIYDDRKTGEQKVAYRTWDATYLLPINYTILIQEEPEAVATESKPDYSDHPF